MKLVKKFDGGSLEQLYIESSTVTREIFDLETTEI